MFQFCTRHLGRNQRRTNNCNSLPYFQLRKPSYFHWRKCKFCDHSTGLHQKLLCWQSLVCTFITTSRLPVYRWNPCKSFFYVTVMTPNNQTLQNASALVIGDFKPSPDRRSKLTIQNSSCACRMVSLRFSLHPIISLVLNSPESNKVLKCFVVFLYNAINSSKRKIIQQYCPLGPQTINYTIYYANNELSSGSVPCFWPPF